VSIDIKDERPLAKKAERVMKLHRSNQQEPLRRSTNETGVNDINHGSTEDRCFAAVSSVI
jgi:hypothetical protein